MRASRNNHLLLYLNSPEMPSCFLKAAKNSLVTKEEPIIFRDCAEAFKSGLTTSGLYTLTFPNSTQEVKVRAPAAGVGRGGAACTGHAPGRCPAPRQAKQRTFLGVPCLQQAQGSESSLCAPTCSARGTDLGAPRSVQSPFSSQWLHRADGQLSSSVRLTSLILKNVSSSTRV